MMRLANAIVDSQISYLFALKSSSSLLSPSKLMLNHRVNSPAKTMRLLRLS